MRKFAPFRYLPRDIIEALEGPDNLYSFYNKELIYGPGEQTNDVYVIKEGSILVENAEENRIHVYGPGIYFGERAILFDEPRRVKVFAHPTAVCWKVPGNLFLDWVRCQMAFSKSLARSLRWKQRIFNSIDQFQATILNGIATHHLDFDRLLELYKHMRPALHPQLKSKDLDTDAWLYAIRRLPHNITSVNMILFSTKILRALESNKELSDKSFVKTSARRRSTHVLIQGKIFVLLRDSTSDLIDFVTNLCLHAVETRKLQMKIGEHISRDVSAIFNSVRSGQKETQELRDNFLEKLPLNEKEKIGLKTIWPNSVIENVVNMLHQLGDYKLMLSPVVDRYYEDISEKWSQKVYEATCQILQCDFLNEQEIIVDIISSNTHSVVNILSPYLHSKRNEILEWGRKCRPDIIEQQKNKICFIFSANTISSKLINTKAHFREHPIAAKERAAMEEANGFTTIFEEDLTGVTVQIIDPSRISRQYHDRYVQPCQISTEKKHLIVNIDFCFGHQAEDILGCLILIYGKSIRSVNVLGKAGGLIGNRGDVLMPTHVLLQVHDELRCVTNAGLEPKKIAHMCGRDVHVGPVLTIEGTLLQDRTLLHYYRKFYHVVGLEMEGSYYVKSIERAMMSGMLSMNLDTRFLYYVSDIPLDTESTLAKSLAPWEGIPPLYATTRVILEQIFKLENIKGYEEKPSGSLSTIALQKTTSDSWKKLKWGLRLLNSFTQHPTPQQD